MTKSESVTVLIESTGRLQAGRHHGGMVLAVERIRRTDYPFVFPAAAFDPIDGFEAGVVGVHYETGTTLESLDGTLLDVHLLDLVRAEHPGCRWMLAPVAHLPLPVAYALVDRRVVAIVAAVMP